MSRVYLRLGALSAAALTACVLIGLWVGRAIDDALRFPR